MASWRDGPEYAPLERPAEFDAADVAPLEQAPAFRQPTANAPQERPQFSGPETPVASLGALVPTDPAEHRDPNRPFDVVATTMTSGSSGGPSAWGAVRGAVPAAPGWGPPTGMPAGVPSGVGGGVASTPFGRTSWDPPAASVPSAPNWPAPTDPFVLSNGPPPSQNGFPAPGTNAWFGYGPPPPPNAGGSPDAKALALGITPPVIIFLLLAIIYPLAPITFVVAWVLSSRLTVARTAVRRSFGIALAAILLFFLIFLAGSDGTTSWLTIFSLCTMFFSFVELIVVGVLVWRGLKRRFADPYAGDDRFPPPRSPWG